MDGALSCRNQAMNANIPCNRYRGIVAALLLIPALPLWAATFTPNSFEDRIDANPGDGICATAPPVVCTLRAAVMEANALAGLDTIALNGGVYPLTREGSYEDAALTGDLDLTDPAGLMILSQPGVFTMISLSRDMGDRVLDVHQGGLVLSGIHLAGGYIVGQGGGIRLAGSRGNKAALIQFSKIEGNVAGAGGGIFVDGGTLEIRHSRFGGNGASELLLYAPEGADIRAVNGAQVRIERSSLIWHWTQDGTYLDDRGSISLDHSTLRMFSSSIIGDGEFSACGIAAWASDVILQNVTLAYNECGLDWANNPFASGSGKGLLVRNSAIANNSVDCDILSVMPAADTIDIDGHNLDSDDSCGLASGFGNLPNTDPRFVPQEWQWDDRTLYALMPRADSPLIDAGSPLDPASGNPEACFQFDQLSVERQVGKCDIGAVERIELFSDGFEQP